MASWHTNDKDCVGNNGGLGSEFGDIGKVCRLGVFLISHVADLVIVN